MGPWYRYIVDFLLITPITTLLFIGYFFYMALLRRFDHKRAYFMCYFVSMFSLLSSLKYGKIVRYVAILDIAISLFAVLMLYKLFRQNNKKYQMYCVFLVTMGISVVNYFNYKCLYVDCNIYDPVIYLLLLAKKIIPY